MNIISTTRDVKLEVYNFEDCIHSWNRRKPGRPKEPELTVLMEFPSADGLLLWVPVIMVLLLIPWISPCHDGRDTEVRGAWPIWVAVVVQVVQYPRYAAVWWWAWAIVAIVSVARSGYSRNSSRGWLALHFTEEARGAGRFLFDATGTAAAASDAGTATAPRLCRRQSVSLPAGEGSRLQQHSPPYLNRLKVLFPRLRLCRRAVIQVSVAKGSPRQEGRLITRTFRLYIITHLGTQQRWHKLIAHLRRH